MTTNVYVYDGQRATGPGANEAAFAMETGAVSTGGVPAPDYTINCGAFVIEKDVHNVVQSVSGYAQLTAAGVIGQNYAIYDGALTGASTLSEVEAAYNGATTMGLLSALTELELTATGFGLVGMSLDTAIQRTVIIRNSDQEVSAYQLILITFPS